jgi:vacuolar-type H+-ATPase subunit H
MGVRMFKAASTHQLDKNGFRLAIAFLIAGLIVCALGLYSSLVRDNNEQKIQTIQTSATQDIRDAKREAEVSVQRMKDTLKDSVQRIQDSLNEKEDSIAALGGLILNKASPDEQNTTLNLIRKNLVTVRDNIERAIGDAGATSGTANQTLKAERALSLGESERS